MQNKILEILKSWSRELPDKNCYGDRAIDYENLEDIASEISSQFTVIAEGMAESISIANHSGSKTSIEIELKEAIGYTEVFPLNMYGKKIQLILREVKE